MWEVAGEGGWENGEWNVETGTSCQPPGVGGGMLAGIEWGAMKAAQVNEKAKGAS